MEEEFKKIVRRLDTLQKTVDLMMGDRNMFEDILSRLGALEQAQHLNKDHQTEVQKDIKADILDVKHAIEDKVDEIRLDTADKTVIVKTNDESIFTKILHKLTYDTIQKK